MISSSPPGSAARIRSLAVLVLVLAVAPHGVQAQTLGEGRPLPTSRAAEAIRLGVERQVQRSGVTIRQTGRGNEAALSQSGADNLGIIVQRGSGHSAILAQTASGNSYTIIQLGRGATALVAQAGGETGATVQAGRSARQDPG